MVKVRTILAAVLLAIVLAVVLKRWLTTEETRIKRQFDKLAETVSVSPEASRTTLLVKSQKIQEVLTNPCSLEVPTYDVDIAFTPREIAREMIATQARLERLDVTFFDLVIDVRQDNQATASATVEVSGTRSTESNAGSDMMEITARLIKEDGTWLFKRIEEVQVLRK